MFSRTVRLLTEFILHLLLLDSIRATTCKNCKKDCGQVRRLKQRSVKTWKMVIRFRTGRDENKEGQGQFDLYCNCRERMLLINMKTERNALHTNIKQLNDKTHSREDEYVAVLPIYVLMSIFFTNCI